MKHHDIKKVLISAATIAACSAFTVLPVYADDTYDDVWAYWAVATMWAEAANIRAAAFSEDSTIVGYLTTAASG